jgi:hypothetical protein
MPQGKQNFAAVDEVLIIVVLIVYPVGGLLVQWRLWAVVCFE